MKAKKKITILIVFLMKKKTQFNHYACSKITFLENQNNLSWKVTFYLKNITFIRFLKLLKVNSIQITIIKTHFIKKECLV